MFNSRELSETRIALNAANQNNLELKEKIKELEAKLASEAEEKRIAAQKASLEAEILGKYKDVAEKSNELSIDNKIAEAIKKADVEIASLKATNAALSAENTVLKKAFENLGFDVQDMKEILNKLVDGVVAKNTVNIVK